MMVVLCKLSDIEFILKIWKKLPRNAFVDEDYLVEIQQRRHTKNKYKGKAKLKYDKLILDGIEYGVEDLNNLPEDMLTLSSCQNLMIIL